MMAHAGKSLRVIAIRKNFTITQQKGLDAMNTAPEQTAVRAHYYIYGIPRVTACAVLTEALTFCRQGYNDPRLGAIAFEVRFTSAELAGLSWKLAFDRALAGLHPYGGRWIESHLFPRCVTASYRTATFRASRAFPTLSKALEFLDLDGERPFEMARLRIHLTAADVWQIVPVTLYSAPVQAWDFAVDSVLGRRAAGASALMPQRNAA